jgi:acyl-CoA thioesterase I
LIKKSLILIGDSLTYGYGVHRKESWTYKLSLIENINIINKGVNGSTTTDMLNRFTKDVSKLNPDIIFIMGGTNDILSNRDLSLTLKNIELMIKESLTVTKGIIIGIPTTVYKTNTNFISYETYDFIIENLKKLRLGLIALCKEFNIKYIDFYTATSSSKYYNDIFIDGIHLNTLGNQIMYEEVVKSLKY